LAAQSVVGLNVKVQGTRQRKKDGLKVRVCGLSTGTRGEYRKEGIKPLQDMRVHDYPTGT